MNGVILAAGLGKRLRSLTKILPKPLLPIGGVPIIQLNIEKLKKAGVKKIGINLYYKADLIKNFLKNFSNLKVVKEKFLSGTGGALLHFKNFSGEDFLLHNCDIVTNIDLKRIIREHMKKKPLATIVLVNNYKTNRVRIFKDKIMRFYKKRTDGCLTYAGIALLSKRIFKYFPENKKVFSLTEVFNQAIKNGELLNGLLVEDLWYDIGTPEVYRRLNYLILKNRIKIEGINEV